MNGPAEQGSSATLGGSSPRSGDESEPGSPNSNGRAPDAARPAEPLEPTQPHIPLPDFDSDDPPAANGTRLPAEVPVTSLGSPVTPETTNGSSAPGLSTSPARLAVGGMIAGRYRLLGQVGADASVHAVFWQARDIVLARDVGLTLLRESSEPGQTDQAAEMINMALRWGRFEHLGCARLLDVMQRGRGGVPDDVLGVAVTEWVEGRSLAETVAAGPPATGRALRMLDPLARCADAAHAQGLVLGCAHPQRIRITAEGQARLAFALPPPSTTPADDVRGLGALLYTLLTGRWPLSGTDAELAGLPAAPRDVQDVAVPPGIVRPGVSLEASALAVGALGSYPAPEQVHTAAAVHQAIEDLLDAEDEVALLPPPNDGGTAYPDEVWRAPGSAPEDEPERKRKVSIGMTCLGAGLLIAAVYVLIQVGSVLGVLPSSTPAIVVGGAPGGTAQGAAPAPAGPGEAGPGGEAVAHPASVRVFDPTGDPDNPGRVARAVDGDPNSSWSTYQYRNPFPVLKPGVGIMVSFATPVQLARLTIVSPSNGSRIEIRSAPTPDAAFTQTIPITDTTMVGGRAVVSLSGSQPVQNVLIWITKLSPANITEISELRFERATG